MGKWEIKREVFNDKTVTGRKKSFFTDDALANFKQSMREKFLELHPNLIDEFRGIHGNLYDYSEVWYEDSSSQLKIICPRHGEFFRTYREHIKGSGCPQCLKEKRRQSSLLDLEEVLKQFIEVHGSFYDYSKVVYSGNKCPVTIICPIHGEFSQKPSIHKSGKGCPQCFRSRHRNYLADDQDVCIQKFKSVHGDLYDYSEVVYAGNPIPVRIICRQHGVFEQRPANHKLGQGCPNCAREGISGLKSQSQQMCIEKFKEVHGDRYDYSKVQYRNARTKVIIVCRKHGEFSQLPPTHKRGVGCPACGYENRHRKSKP